MPRISVISGAYNVASCYSFERSVESVLTQSFSDFEFIICDDGSSDETFEKLSHYAEKDSRKYGKHTHLKGNMFFVIILFCRNQSYGIVFDFRRIQIHVRINSLLSYPDRFQNYSIMIPKCQTLRL